MPERTANLTATDYYAITPEWVLWHPDLSDRAVRLYGTLRRYADKGGEGAMPKRSTLAQHLKGCSLDSVDRALAELKAAGAVSWERRQDPAGDPTSSLYTVHATAAPVRQGSRTPAATPSRTTAATGSRTRAAQEESPSDPQPSDPQAPAAEAACATAGCSRPAGHPGAHLNPWWDAIVEAIYPGEQIPTHQEPIAGRLASRARRAGHPPERILEAAAWIATTWGPEKLTLTCLNQHYERATGELARNASQVQARLRAALRPGTARPAHQHRWEQHHARADLEVCTAPGCPAGQRRKEPAA